jgi:raffinose/stachyose/melibiose transport system substrate-binding protein
MQESSKKRVKAGVAAFVAAASVIGLSACGNSSSSSNGNVTVTVWENSTTGDGKQYWLDAAAAYHKAHPKVTVKVTAIQNEDMDGKLQTALQDPSSAPDIFLARGGQKLADVVDAGQAMDLTNKLSPEVKKNMKAGLKANTVHGKIYGVPQSVLPGGLWYSKDLFQKAGITKTPQTWDEFKEVIAKLKAANITPIALGAKDAWPAAHWWYWFALRECSSSTFNKAMDSKNFSDKCWIKAGEDVQELIDLKPFNEGYLTTTAQQGASSSAGLIANHMAAMELMGGWEPGVIRDLTPDKKDMKDLGYFAFPTIKGQKGSKTAVMAGVDGMTVGSWAPKEAVDFLNFISTKSWQEKYAKAFSTIPANTAASSVVTNPALKDAMNTYSHASSVSPWLDTLFGQNVGNALNAGVVNMMVGKGTPQSIISSVESAAKK